MNLTIDEIRRHNSSNSKFQDMSGWINTSVRCEIVLNCLLQLYLVFNQSSLHTLLPVVDSNNFPEPSLPCDGRQLQPTSASKSSIQRFVVTEKAPTRAFSWLKAATTAFTFKTLLSHYAKRALTPRSLNVKLCPRRKGQKGRAGWLA